MGLLDFFKEKANNPSIAGFNAPLLQQHPKRSAEYANQDKTENMLAETLRPVLKTFLEQNPTANKEEAGKFLIQGYNNKVEAEFTPEQRQAFARYKGKHSITPFRFKVLWDRAEKEFKGSGFKESAVYNFGQYANLLGADNLQDLQQIEINRLKQNRGQGLFTKETGLDMLTDLPAWLLPAGMVSKVGTKAFNVARSALGGAGMGAALGLKELNRDDVSFKDNASDMGFGALAGGLLNAGFALGLNKLSTKQWLGGNANAMQGVNGMQGANFNANLQEGMQGGNANAMQGVNAMQGKGAQNASAMEGVAQGKAMQISEGTDANAMQGLKLENANFNGMQGLKDADFNGMQNTFNMQNGMQNAMQEGMQEGMEGAQSDAVAGFAKLLRENFYPTEAVQKGMNVSEQEVLLRNAKASPYPQNADEAVKSESISNPSLEQGSPLQSYLSSSILPKIKALRLAQEAIPKPIKEIIDSSAQKGRDMQTIGKENFTPQVVEYAHRFKKKVAIDKLEPEIAQKLGFKYPLDVRMTMDYQAINHTLNRHGANSPLVQQSGQKAVDYNDIAEYRNIVKSADESLNAKDNLGQDVIVSFKQINGHAVVVESIRKKGNELAFKSMYFENGSYKESNAFKNAVESQKANHFLAPYGYEPHADASTPQKVDKAKAQTLSIGYEPSANSFASADGIIPQNNAQKEAFLQDLVALAREYPQIFNTYQDALKQAFSKYPQVFFKAGRLNVENARKMLEFMQERIKQAQTKESLDKNSLELEGLESKLSTKNRENKQSTLDSSAKDFDTSADSNMSLSANAILPKNALEKMQVEYQNAQKDVEIKQQSIQDFLNANKDFHALVKGVEQLKWNRIREGLPGILRVREAVQTLFLKTPDSVTPETLANFLEFEIARTSPLTYQEGYKLAQEYEKLYNDLLEAYSKRTKIENAIEQQKYAKGLNARLKNFENKDIKKLQKEHSNFTQSVQHIFQQREKLQQKVDAIEKEWAKASDENTPKAKLLAMAKKYDAAKKKLEDFMQSKEYKDAFNQSSQMQMQIWNKKIETTKQTYLMEEDLAGEFLMLRNAQIDKQSWHYYGDAFAIYRARLENFFNINPTKEFGTNYAEYYHDGKNGIVKLINEAQAHKGKEPFKGQVAGAFYREELGDIDLVWGEVQGKGNEAKGYGLAKIIEKHLNAGDFEAFGKGEAGLINAMSEIIDKGKVISQNGVDSIVLHKNGEEYRIGISKGWDKQGQNKWIITSYKNNKYKESAETSYHDTFTSKEPLGNLADAILPKNALNDELIKTKSQRQKQGSNSVSFTKGETLPSNSNKNAIKFNPSGKDLMEQSSKSKDIDTANFNAPSENPTSILPKKTETLKQKQKTIEKIDSYAKSDAFKALSKNKQEAILSLKTIQPSPMPKEITQENLENLFKHFNSKQDKAQREFYAKLFDDTKQNPHIVLEVKRNNELRQEYIKAYEHKPTHDLYYIAITKDKDKIKVTGYPITKIKDVINQIKNAEKVVWRQQGDQAHTALDSKQSLNLESANAILPKNPSILFKVRQLMEKQNAVQKESSVMDALQKFAPKLAQKIETDLALENLNPSLREARVRFALTNKDKENAKLFERVLASAQSLGVKFENTGKSLKGEMGHYNPKTNTAKVFAQGEKEAETILHELIHSVTFNALRAKSETLTPLQREGVKEIHTLFESLSKEKHLKAMYALSSVDEMLAELSNKAFRAMLRGRNVLERIVNAIAKIVFRRQDGYDALKNALFKVLDNDAGKRLEKDFLKDDRVDLNALKSQAVQLPKPMDEAEFKGQFKDVLGTKASVQTPIGKVSVDINFAWKHLTQNTYNKDRREFSGAFLDTLNDPLFVVKQEYTPTQMSANARVNANSKLVQVKSNAIIPQDSYAFFKPYVSGDNLHMVSYSVSKNGELLNKTFIPMKDRDLGWIKKMMQGDLLYYKNAMQYKKEFDLREVDVSTKENVKYYADLVGIKLSDNQALLAKMYLQGRLKELAC